MSAILTVILGWLVASVPVGLVVGRLLARASDPVQADAAPARKRPVPEVIPYRPRVMASGEPLQNGD